MAAALFCARAGRDGVAEQFEVTSAGTWGVEGEPAAPLAESVMAERGLSLAGHVARTVTCKMLDDADLVLVMTRSHREALAAEFPGVRPKVHLMAELAGMEYDISDPYGRPLDVYQTCAADLELLIDRGFARIGQWLGATPDRTYKV